MNGSDAAAADLDRAGSPAPSGAGAPSEAALLAARRLAGRAKVLVPVPDADEVPRLDPPAGSPWAPWAPWDWSPVVEQVRAAFGHVALADRFTVTEERRPDGTVLVVDHPPAVRLAPLPSAEDVRAALLSHLELVPGIGPVTAQRLRAEGIRTVADLVEPSRHAAGAAEVAAEWEADDLAAVGERLRSRLAGRGHLLATLLAGCVDPADIAFVDLETLGLAGNAVFLCGVGRLGPDGLAVRQYLAPAHADEPAVLASALDELADARVVVTYNGRTADVVWLRSRCFFHGLAPVPDVLHLDLVFGTRRRFVRDDAVLVDARLPTVQRRLLRVRRPVCDVPSAAVPELYQTAVRDGCAGLLVPVLDHNRSDLEALVLLLSTLAAEAMAWCG